jgi:hypothetical protein
VEVAAVEKTNLLEVLHQLLGPQQQALNFNEIAGLLGLVDLLGILNLLHGNVAIPAKAEGSNVIQEALNAVLGQGSGGNVKPPADLAGLLGKNPALLTSLMNLLMSAKESRGVKEKEAQETVPKQENPPPQQTRSNRFRSN